MPALLDRPLPPQQLLDLPDSFELEWNLDLYHSFRSDTGPSLNRDAVQQHLADAFYAPVSDHYEPRWPHEMTALLLETPWNYWIQLHRAHIEDWDRCRREETTQEAKDEAQSRSYARFKGGYGLYSYFLVYVDYDMSFGHMYEEVWDRLAPFGFEEKPNKDERDKAQKELSRPRSKPKPEL
ncbi:hypothetical protein JCM8547_007739 [Rhodosporidiobolus lusitaniae]